MYEASTIAGAMGPATTMDCGNRSTSDTAMRKPAANESIASSARTLHVARDVTARAPRTFAPAAARPYNNADGVTPVGVRAAPQPPSRHSRYRARPETAGG